LFKIQYKVIIGQKYGVRPLPRRVEKHEFEILKEKLEGEDLSVAYYSSAENDEPPVSYSLENVLDVCYRLDTNSIPAMYRLVPISKIVPDYRSSSLRHQECAREFWKAIETKLSKMLRKAAHEAYSSGLIEASKRERYFVSSKIFLFPLKENRKKNLDVRV
jgi:hypothetical protein